MEKVAKVSTRCYTYEVKMVAIVLASNEEEAESLLNNQGGYVSIRKVELIDDKPIYQEK